MRFIITLLSIYLIWQVVKFLFKIAFRYWLRKNGNRFFYYSSSNGPNPFRGHQQGKEGDIRVENPETFSSGSKKQSDRNLGEYVDFEEVK